MFSYQKRNEAAKLLSVLEAKDNDFLTALYSADSRFNSVIINYVNEMATTDSVHWQDEFMRTCAGLIDSLRHFPLRGFYSSLEETEAQLKKYFELRLIGDESVQKLKKEIDAFSRSFQNSVNSGSHKTILEMIIKAKKLSSSFRALEFALGFYLGNSLVESAEKSHVNSADLSIALTSKMDMSSFIAKLTAINIIYTETCFLFNISTSEYPLVVNNIESGSLLAQVFGNDKVIGLMIVFISSSATYAFNNFTEDGQLSGIPKKVEQVDSVLKLTVRLEEAGIDTTEMKDNIAKAAVRLSKQLNTLLDGESEIVVNNKSFSVFEEMQHKSLPSVDPFRLNHDRDDTLEAE